MKTFLLESRYLITLVNSFFRSVNSFLRIVKLNLPANNVAKEVGKIIKTRLECNENINDEDSDSILEPLLIGPLVAPYGVDANEFSLQFNTLSAGFEKGFPLRVYLYLLPDRKFNIELKSISSSTIILNYVLFENRRRMPILVLYKILLIRFLLTPFNIKKTFRILLGTLRSFKINIFD